MERSITTNAGVYTSGSALVADTIKAGTITADVIYQGEKNFKPLLLVRVESIENGLLAYVSTHEHGIAQRVYIKDLDELPGVLTARLAAERIGAK